MTRSEAVRGGPHQIPTYSRPILRGFLLLHGDRNDHRPRLCPLHREHLFLDRTGGACGLDPPLSRRHEGLSGEGSEDQSPSNRDGRRNCVWEGLISIPTTLQQHYPRRGFRLKLKFWQWPRHFWSMCIVYNRSDER